MNYVQKMFYLPFFVQHQKSISIFIIIINIIKLIQAYDEMTTIQPNDEQYSVELLNDSIRINSNVYHKWTRPFWNTGKIITFFSSVLIVFSLLFFPNRKFG